MSTSTPTEGGPFNRLEKVHTLLEIIEHRRTSRAFDASYRVPVEHYELILEAARHAPSGANAQPWHYIVVTDPQVKCDLAERFRQEQRERAELKMKFPTPDYAGMRTAPGVIVVVADFRFVRAFPVLNDDSELDRSYKQNAERILLQSVAASVMSAHLAAAALGYAVWWVSAIGQEAIQTEFKPVLGVPEDLTILDIMCFGPPAKPPYKRWKRELREIMSWNRYNPECYLQEEAIDDWIRTRRHKVMFRDQSNVD